ncbi:MAG: Spi family protease inhibitor, partial [Bacteroidota bacterium]
MRYLLSIISLTLLLSLTLNAKPVDEPTAGLAAVNFYRSVSGTQPTALSVTHAFTEQALLNEESVALYYIFDIGEQGFVIVSADDNLLLPEPDQVLGLLHRLPARRCHHHHEVPLHILAEEPCLFPRRLLELFHHDLDL